MESCKNIVRIKTNNIYTTTDQYYNQVISSR